MKVLEPEEVHDAYKLLFGVGCIQLSEMTEGGRGERPPAEKSSGMRDSLSSDDKFVAGTRE